MSKILIVAAHPDDEILGCAGTAAKLVQEGNQLYTLILGEGITSRDETRDAQKRSDEIKELKDQTQKANEIIGVKEVFTYDFPDNRFDSVPLLDIIKRIESIKNKIQPRIIYTHYYGDLNVDHQLTYKAVMTACRPLPDEGVKEIYSFEVASSTEWAMEEKFSPEVYVDITDTFDKKLEALKVYRNEIRKFPHPRSPEAVALIAKRRGIEAGMSMAESFKLIRQLKK